MKTLRFKVVEVAKTSDGERFYAKLFTKYTASEGELGPLSQKVEKQITYFYPMDKLNGSMKVGKPKDVHVSIPHKEFDGELRPMGFIVRKNSFTPEGEENEIETKWLFHAPKKAEE